MSKWKDTAQELEETLEDGRNSVRLWLKLYEVDL